MDGKFIKEWSSSYEAARCFNTDGSCLMKCAKGQYRFYNGFIWSYNKILSEDRIIKANNPIKRSKESKIKMSIAAKNRTDHKKPIIQYDKNMNFIKEWKCSQDVLLELNKNGSGMLSECLHNKRKTAFGYIWKFKPV
jgi:hypothetical protein